MIVVDATPAVGRGVAAGHLAISDGEAGKNNGRATRGGVINGENAKLGCARQSAPLHRQAGRAGAF